MHEKTGIPNVSIYHYKIMFRLLLGICTRTVREEPGPGDIYLRVELLRFSYCPRKNFSRVFSSMNTRAHHHHYYMPLYFHRSLLWSTRPSQPHFYESRTSWISLGTKFRLLLFITDISSGRLKTCARFSCILTAAHSSCAPLFGKKKPPPVRLRCTCHQRISLRRRSVVNWYRICHRMLAWWGEGRKGFFYVFP